MKIAIDLRSLQSGRYSGVENYITNVVEHLLRMDKNNSYTLFYNSLRSFDHHHLRYINSREVRTRIPNKLLNLSLMMLKAPNLEKLAGDFDCLFLPNLNQFAIKPSTKLIVSVHDLSFVAEPNFYNAKRRIWHSILPVKKTFNRANLIFAVSEYTKQDIIRHFPDVDAKKIIVAPPAIDPHLYHSNIESAKLREVRNLYSLPGDFILFIGTLEPRKNVEGLIKAFELMDDSVDLVIAGSLGWSYGAIFKALRNSKKRRNIKYIGFIPEAHKPALIKLAKVFVWPSLYEGFGIPPLEALQVGTPVVTSQITSLPEVVGTAAIMVNPRNTREIAYAISEVLNNHELREKLITAGYEQAKKFSWETTSEKILSGIQQL